MRVLSRKETRGGFAVTRSGIAIKINEATGRPVRRCREYLDCVLRNIRQELAAGGVVVIRGFGELSVVDKAARVGRNPKTGSQVIIKARRRVRMKISRTWKNAMANNLWRKPND